MTYSPTTQELEEYERKLPKYREEHVKAVLRSGNIQEEEESKSVIIKDIRNGRFDLELIATKIYCKRCDDFTANILGEDPDCNRGRYVFECGKCGFKDWSELDSFLDHHIRMTNTMHNLRETI